MSRSVIRFCGLPGKEFPFQLFPVDICTGKFPCRLRALRHVYNVRQIKFPVPVETQFISKQMDAGFKTEHTGALFVRVGTPGRVPSS
eukprot:1143736-Pelagomonas_calceolata.AAC.1